MAIYYRADCSHIGISYSQQEKEKTDGLHLVAGVCYILLIDAWWLRLGIYYHSLDLAAEEALEIIRFYHINPRGFRLGIQCHSYDFAAKESSADIHS